MEIAGGRIIVESDGEYITLEVDKPIEMTASAARLLAKAIILCATQVEESAIEE